MAKINDLKCNQRIVKLGLPNKLQVLALIEEVMCLYDIHKWCVGNEIIIELRQ